MVAPPATDLQRVGLGSLVLLSVAQRLAARRLRSGQSWLSTVVLVHSSVWPRTPASTRLIAGVWTSSHVGLLRSARPYTATSPWFLSLRANRPQPSAATRDVAMLAVAERRKHAAYPELLRQGFEWFCALACEVGGGWNTESPRLVTRPGTQQPVLVGVLHDAAAPAYTQPPRPVACTLRRDEDGPFFVGKKTIWP